MDSPLDRDLTATVKRDPPLFVKIPGAPDFNPTAQMFRGKTPRSWSDRTAITARSSRDREAFIVESPPWDHTATDGESRPRSTHDRGPIASRSWPDHGAIVARSWRDRGSFEAKIRADSPLN